LPLFIKELLKEDIRFLGGLAFGFYFGLFWCGKLWEGKRITEGKELLKENC
jgi:hypothetical protein